MTRTRALQTPINEPASYSILTTTLSTLGLYATVCLQQTKCMQIFTQCLGHYPAAVGCALGSYTLIQSGLSHIDQMLSPNDTQTSLTNKVHSLICYMSQTTTGVGLGLFAFKIVLQAYTV